MRLQNDSHKNISDYIDSGQRIRVSGSVPGRADVHDALPDSRPALGRGPSSARGKH